MVLRANDAPFDGERYYPSYYNVSAPIDDDGALLFNGVTSALLRLDRELASDLLPMLGLPRSRTAGRGYDEWVASVRQRPFDRAAAPESVDAEWERLIEAGVLVRGDPSQRDGLANQYTKDRADAQFLVTITTTLECNMRCYYCYQGEKKYTSMSLETIAEIRAWTKEHVAAGGFRALFVDWYGGEPLLNQPVMDAFSDDLTAWCDERGIRYTASIISNGSIWPDDVGPFVRRHRLNHAQFTIDGPPRFHNRRRGTLGSDGKGRVDSYDTVIAAAKNLVDHLNLSVRINVDPTLGWSALELIDAFEAEGLLSSPRFVPYLAIVNAMTEHCGFLKTAPGFDDFADEFDRINAAFCARVAEKRGRKVLERSNQVPARLRLNCGAVSDNSVVFGPEGLAYKCTLDVGDAFRAHASVNGTRRQGDLAVAPELKERASLDPERWDRYDPFGDERCGQCQYLPVCLGGCPKSHLENEEDAMIAQRRYWENNIERTLRDYARAGG